MNVFVGCKAVVCQFDVHIIIKQNVFDLDVTMYNILVVHIVHCPDQLTEEKSAHVFSHASEILAQVEHEAATHVLHLDVDDVLDDPSGGLDDLTIGAVIDQTDNIFVVHTAQNLDFLFYVLHNFGASLEVLRLHDLDGDLLRRILQRSTKVHFGSIARA